MVSQDLLEAIGGSEEARAAIIRRLSTEDERQRSEERIKEVMEG